MEIEEILSVKEENELKRFTNKKYAFEFISSESEYGFGFKGKTWLRGGGWRVISEDKVFTREDLEYEGSYTVKGIDELGRYIGATYRWRGGINASLEFRVYEGSFVVTKIEVDGLVSGKHVDIDFPMFADPSKVAEDICLSAIMSDRAFPFIRIVKPPKTLEKFAESSAHGTQFLPLWVYDEERSLVLLPMDNFIDYRVVNLREEGLKGFSLRLSGICPSSRIEARALMYYSEEGPSEALIRAGGLLRKLYDKVPVSREIPCFKFLGYSTANGSYYFNRFDEKVILDVIDYMEREGIPVKWMQLDVMWYKCGIHPDVQRTLVKLFKGVKFSEIDGMRYINTAWAIHELEPDEKYFPNGFENIKARMPIGVWIWTTRFTEDTPYKQKYPWIEEENLPKSREFWLDIAKRFKEYNVIWVETDNLCDILGRKGVLERIGEKERWLLNVFEAFGEYNIPVQLCMTPSIIYPVALKSRNACLIRTGDDFRMPPDSTKLYQDFYNSALAWAFGLYPCFDVFFTSEKSYEESDKLEPVDWGFPEIGYITVKESNVRFQLLAHALSCGITYIGDAIGTVDKEAVARLCLSNGEVVRPDRPAIPVRQCYLRDPLSDRFPLIVYTTVKGYVLVGVFNMSDETVEYAVPFRDIGIEGEYYDFEYFSNRVMLVRDELRGTVEGRACQLHILCPVLGGFAVVGDVNKFIAPYAIIRAELADGRLVVSTESVDQVDLAVIYRDKPREVVVDGVPYKDWEYKDYLLKIVLTPGRHNIQIIT